jgi:hypothetical protein
MHGHLDWTKLAVLIKIKANVSGKRPSSIHAQIDRIFDPFSGLHWHMGRVLRTEAAVGPSAKGKANDSPRPSRGVRDAQVDNRLTDRPFSQIAISILQDETTSVALGSE